MTKTVIIDGKEVRLRASAAIPRIYRIKFKRDILVDMRTIKKSIDAQVEQRKAEGKPVDEESAIPIEALTLFEDVAYIMARHAGPQSVPGTVDEWLDGFNTFSIYTVFPVIQELWEDNLAQLNVPQKK